MPGLIPRLAWAVIALAFLTSPAAAQTRPLAVDDIVRLESFGRASIAPNGRWAVYEKRGPYDSAPRFDLGPRSQWAIMDLRLVDLTRPGSPPERLLPQEGLGLLRGAWSPSGARLLIYRFGQETLEVGIVTMADRTVRWTGLTPEMPLMGAAFEWMSDDRVALVVRSDSSLPWLLRYYRDGQSRTTEAWRRTADGQQPSRTIVETDAGVAEAETSSADERLVVLDVNSGSVRSLKRGRVVDFAVSPDGSRIAVTEEAEAVAVRPETINQAEAPTRQRLTLIELKTGQTADVDPRLDVAPHLLRWSPDSSTLLVWGRLGDDPWSDGGLFTVDPRGGLAAVDRHGLEPVAPQAGINILQGVRAEWMGETPVLYARKPGDPRYDWYALAPGRAPVALTQVMSNPPTRVAAVSCDALFVFGDGAYWALDAGGARRLTPTALTIEDIVIGDVEKPFRLRVNDAPRRQWAAGVSPNGDAFVVSPGHRPRRLGPVEGAREARVLAVDTGTALVVERSGLVESLHLRTATGERDIDQVNANLAGVGLPAAITLNHADASGRPVQSWLFLPEGDLAAVEGVVVQIYPGSVDRGAWSGPMTLTYGVRAQVLAGAGYAVISPFVPAGGPPSAEGLERSVDAAVDAALETYPALPRDRIAILGHSFGGNAALWIATRSTRYRAYIARAATSDMFGQWGEFTPAARAVPEEGFMFRNQQGWAEVGQAALAGPPWSNVQRYADASPYLAADCITAPVLLIAADKDFVAVSQSERMFSALHRLGRQARLVTYWGEEHMIWSPANIRDLYSEILAWLERTLAEAPARSAMRPAGCSTP